MVHLLCSVPPCSGFPWNPDSPSPSTLHLQTGTSTIHCVQCCIAKRGSLFIKCTASAPSATLEDVQYTRFLSEKEGIHRGTPEIVHQKVTPWIENCGEAQLDDRRDQVGCFDAFPSPSKHHGTVLHMEALAVGHHKAIPCMENCGEAELDPLCIAGESFDAFPSLLKHHGKSKSLSDGRLVHCRIIACGYDGSTFMANCLVQMYGDCGSLHDAETAFHKMPYPNQYSWNILVRTFSQNGSLDDAMCIFIRMPHRDVVSWNGMIGASIQLGRCKEALDLFIQMQHEGIQPNRISLLAALNACSSMASLNEGHKIHAIIIDSGFDRDDPIGNALINMHAKCGNLEGAKVMFGRMQECNVISWSAMIAAYARNGHCEDGLSLFYRMQAEGIKPDKITFISVLSACANLGALAEGQQIHAAIMDCKYEHDVTVGNALVNMYAKCGNFCNARLVFDQLSERDVVSWTTLIGACSHTGHDKEALEMFGQMQHEGVKPNHLTIVCALDACANLGALKEGKEIHEAIANSGYVENVYVGNALVNMYGKCGLLDEARDIFSTMSQQNVASWNSLITVCGQSGSVDEALSLFERMPERNVISWNALISALVQNGHGKEAIECFDQMQLESIIPNKVTFVTVLDACASLGAQELGLQLHTLSICTGYEQDGILQNALVNMYGKCCCLDNAKFVFDMMHQRNVISWSAMIAAYVKNGQGNQAVDLFWKMELQGVRPDKITFTCLLAACANLATIEEGQKVHASIVAGNLEADLAVGNALLSMYGRCGSIESVKIVFSRMHHQDVVSWTAVIAACAQCGESKAALELFSQMQVEGIKPDEVTFISVLTACCHSGQVDDGRRYFSSMVRDYGLAYRSDHYVCMVDLLGRAGHLEEAEDLIYSMPVDKIYLAWLSLLGSCRNHGDIKHGIRAALCCFQSDPKNDAPFSLLSSIFAAAGRSNGQAKMNELQKLCLEKQVEELVQELLSVFDEL